MSLGTQPMYLMWLILTLLTFYFTKHDDESFFKNPVKSATNKLRNSYSLREERQRYPLRTVNDIIKENEPIEPEYVLEKSTDSTLVFLKRLLAKVSLESNDVNRQTKRPLCFHFLSQIVNT